MKNKLFLLNLLIGAMIIFSLAANAQIAGNQDGKKIGATEPVSTDTGRIKTPDIVDFSGAGTDEIFPNGKSWTFFGPVKPITVNGSQRIISSASAVFGTNSGTSQISVSVCYLKSDGTIASFAGDNHLIADADFTRRTFAVTVAATPAAGTYSVGYCVINSGPQTLGDNDYVNGWLMVVN